MEREEFVRKTLRFGILATIAGTTTYLALNKRIDLSCTDGGICASCSKYGVCNLDKALKAREDERK